MCHFCLLGGKKCLFLRWLNVLMLADFCSQTESESVQALRDTVSRLEDEKVSAAEAAAAAGAKVREVQAELENSVQFYKERVDQLQGKNRQLEEALDQQAQRYLSEMGVKTAQLEEVLQTEIQSALQERRNLEEV